MPHYKFRVIRHTRGHRTLMHFYKTQESRDRSARKFSEKDGHSVILEFWSEGNNQDSLNLGWACDGFIGKDIEPKEWT